MANYSSNHLPLNIMETNTIVAESQAMVTTSRFFHSYLYTFHVQLDGHTPSEDTRMC